MASQSWMDEALSCELAWWLTGDSLAKSAEVLRNSVSELPQIKNRVVGASIQGKSPRTEGDMWRRRLTAEMLYAFAVENWLKGILVCTFVRSSGNLRRKAQETLGLELGIKQELQPEQFFVLLLFAISGHLPEASAKAHEDFAIQIETENFFRRNAIQQHKQHDLLRLAEETELPMTKSLRTYLSKLSDVVQVGRYPAHLRKDVGNLTQFVGNELLRSELDEALGKKVEEVLAHLPQEDLELFLE